MPYCIFCEKPDSEVMIPGTDIPTCPHCLSVQVVAAQTLNHLIDKGISGSIRDRVREYVAVAEEITNGRSKGPSMLYRRARRRCEAEDPHLCFTLPCPRCAGMALEASFTPNLPGGPPPEMLREV